MQILKNTSVIGIIFGVTLLTLFGVSISCGKVATTTTTSDPA